MERTIRNFSAQSIDGEIISLGNFYGKVILVVNTASKCKLVTQLRELQRFYKEHENDGFVILGFPCDQFMRMEPEDDYSIKISCLQQHGVTFPMFSKIDVVGKDAHALFKWLQNELMGFPTHRILWNFTKFVIDRNGRPVKRFGPYIPTSMVENYIKKIL